MPGPSTYDSDAFPQGGLNHQLDVDELVAGVGADRAELNCRKDSFGFDHEVVNRLTASQDIFADHAKQIVDGFYANLPGHEATSEILARSPKNVHHVKRTQSAYGLPKTMVKSVEVGSTPGEATMIGQSFSHNQLTFHSYK